VGDSSKLVVFLSLGKLHGLHMPGFEGEMQQTVYCCISLQNAQVRIADNVQIIEKINRGKIELKKNEFAFIK